MISSSPHPSPPSESLFANHWTPPSEDDSNSGSYSRVSVVALCALAVSLCSGFIFISTTCIVFSFLGILLSLCAIWSIHRSGSEVFGLGIARTALAISIVAMMATLIYIPYYNKTVEWTAISFADHWFDAAQHNDFPVVWELQRPFWQRNLPEDSMDWWKKHISETRSHEMLHATVKNSLIRTLIALGDKAEIRYYGVKKHTWDETKHYMELIYSVTYSNSHGERETFFVELPLQRTYHPKDGMASWAVHSLPTGAAKPPTPSS